MPKVIDQSSNIWGFCPTNLEDAILWIERAGRNCYRSEDMIVEGSGIKFVNNIIKRGHLSVLEHSNLVIASDSPLINKSAFLRGLDLVVKYYLGGNFRAWMEVEGVKALEALNGFNLLPDESIELVSDIEDIPMQLRRVTVELLTDRAVLAEITRHRDCSFSVESQRYCAYHKELTVVRPWHYKGQDHIVQEATWLSATSQAEQVYKQLLNWGERPEQARSVLPNSTAVNIVMTAPVGEWGHIFNLRCSKAAYPQISELLTPVQSEFKERGWIL